ncbi:GNAT family N-acetyltransferase [Salicibibacter cibi]|uniref:GNAT family N-acetyltransferase n=1 Tax=Salicibibacter cibi TaxID=2743001 RepID=A0A7T6ZBT3_9BACI|nr:GNAT family protein [Salicibibacter cibi]QQK80442.1 GNAT family N-acetyltransferase [Salicibibacter cibi]
MLEGNKTYLRLMEEQDVPYKVKWVNDPEVRKTLNIEVPISEVGTKKWLLNVSLDNTRKDFIICDLNNNVPIGFGGFINIDLRYSKAEAYLVIGGKEYRGQGIGFEVKKLLTVYGFKELGINRIYSYMWAGNDKMIRLNEKLGYTVEGRLREDVFTNGEFRDRVMMSMLKKEYTGIF